MLIQCVLGIKTMRVRADIPFCVRSLFGFGVGFIYVYMFTCVQRKNQITNVTKFRPNSDSKAHRNESASFSKRQNWTVGSFLRRHWLNHFVVRLSQDIRPLQEDMCDFYTSGSGYAYDSYYTEVTH